MALLALAVACGKDETPPADTGKTPSGMDKTMGDMKKAAEDAGKGAMEMRTVTLKVEGMT